MHPQSLTHSLSHSIAHTLTHSLIHSPTTTQSIIQLLTHPLTQHPPNHLATQSLNHSTTHSTMINQSLTHYHVFNSQKKRGRGRPRKTKNPRGAGRKRKSTTITDLTPPHRKKPRGLAASRLSSLDFMTPPPGPQKEGRPLKPRLVGSGCVMVGKEKHVLISTSSRHWSGYKRGYCKSCYAGAPPLTKEHKIRLGSRARKKFMSDGTPIPRVYTVCYTCKDFLCSNCHFNV